jgi:hypothetical protein
MPGTCWCCATAGAATFASASALAAANKTDFTVDSPVGSAAGEGGASRFLLAVSGAAFGVVALFHFGLHVLAALAALLMLMLAGLAHLHMFGMRVGRRLCRSSRGSGKRRSYQHHHDQFS